MCNDKATALFAISDYLFDALFMASCTHLSAAITASGGVNPPIHLPGLDSTTAYIGQTANGIVTVDSGSDILSRYAYIGYSSWVLGRCNRGWQRFDVDQHSDLHIGSCGNGTLKITGGGAVNNYIGYIGENSGSLGTVSVDGATQSGRTIRTFISGILGMGLGMGR